MPRKIKGLFVSHVPASSIYGAGTSFRLMMNNLPTEIEGSLVLPTRLNPFRDHKKLRQAEREMYPKRFKIHMERLPFDNCYEGGEVTFVPNSSTWIQNTASFLVRYRLHRLIRNGNFDFVYLNSLVLNPLIQTDVPSFLHVREVYKGHNARRHKRISSARGLIFIDTRTRDALLSETTSPNSVVLNNPVDMRKAQSCRVDHRAFFELLNLPVLPQTTRVFSCIGTISPVKGVDLAIRAFTRAAMDNALLLIVGRTTDKAYLSACKKAASRQHNIFFLGEIKDMLPIYAHSDFVVRSDPDFRIGRTIFEGLYAGCGAILPGSDDDVNTTQELIPFKERVFCYAPGDFEAFAEQLKQCEKLARPKRTYESNVPEYIQSVTDFLLGSISS